MGLPPDANAAFVAGMEDVLEVYHRPHDPDRPVVCLDETSKQLIAETRVPIPAKPGHPKRYDYEYERNGTANLFMMFEPLGGKRHVIVTERRTAVDYAHAIQNLVDVQYPDARKIVLVQDNLNTHKPASLYEAFAPEEARRLVEKLEIHYTPKHGSWLNMAETELGVVSPVLGSTASRSAQADHRSGGLGSATATKWNVRSIGNSPPPTPGSN